MTFASLSATLKQATSDNRLHRTHPQGVLRPVEQSRTHLCLPSRMYALLLPALVLKDGQLAASARAACAHCNPSADPRYFYGERRSGYL